MEDEHMMPLDDDVHLARLLAPPNVEEPWLKTIFKGIHEFFHPPKPPELTSPPAEVKDIWGAYGGPAQSGTRISVPTPTRPILTSYFLYNSKTHRHPAPLILPRILPAQVPRTQPP